MPDMNTSAASSAPSYSSAVIHADLSHVKPTHNKGDDKTKLEMEDFLNLMVVTLQNQTIDSTVDTADMMNQMVQMSVVQAISDISTLIEDSTTMTYAASLVGKDVTIGQWIGDELKETEGTVVGTGTLNGEQVIFLEGDDNAYKLTDIMGVGKLPEKIVVPGTETDETQSGTETDKTESGADKPVENPDDAQESGGAEESRNAYEVPSL